MTQSIKKNKSFDLERKPNSHKKLPKIQSVENLNKLQSVPSSRLSKANENQSTNLKGQKKSFLMKLEPIQNQLGKKSLRNKSTIQCLDVFMLEIEKKPLKIQRKDQQPKQDNNEAKQVGKGKFEERFNIRESKDESQRKIGLTTTIGSDGRSDNSSRENIHPIITEITNLISEETKQEIVATKMFDKKQLGQIDPLWWCAVDTVLISLQKLIKVKRLNSPDKEKRQKGKKQKKKPEQQKNNEKQKTNAKKTQIEGEKNEIGKSITKLKPSIELARVYCYLEPEIIQSDKIVLNCFEDPNHTFLILEAMFLQKVVIYLIGSIRKWDHADEQFFIHNLAVQLIPIVIETRKLIAEILIEAAENEADDKIKKPKYIARQKKLIQISKFTSFMKTQLDKCLQSIGSPNRYKIFAYGYGFRDYNALYQLQCKWRNIIFNVPLVPYFPPSKSQKEFLLVLQPLNILYKYNKKQQFLLIDPQVSYFLQKISQFFQIVFFTNTDKQTSLLNFMAILDKFQILGILDKHYFSHKKAKVIKDIEKIGAGFDMKKTLILDDKQNQRYYFGCDDSLYLIDSNRSEMRLGKIKGKLVRIQENDDEFLRKLAQKIVSCAEKGGHWKELKKN